MQKAIEYKRRAQQVSFGNTAASVRSRREVAVEHAAAERALLTNQVPVIQGAFEREVTGIGLCIIASLIPTAPLPARDKGGKAPYANGEFLALSGLSRPRARYWCRAAKPDLSHGAHA